MFLARHLPHNPSFFTICDGICFSAAGDRLVVVYVALDNFLTMVMRSTGSYCDVDWREPLERGITTSRSAVMPHGSGV